MIVSLIVHASIFDHCTQGPSITGTLTSQCSTGGVVIVVDRRFLLPTPHVLVDRLFVFFVRFVFLGPCHTRKKYKPQQTLIFIPFFLSLLIIVICLS